nr:MAG TPA: hypothetical protein [Caudoviricetes sp.]
MHVHLISRILRLFVAAIDRPFEVLYRACVARLWGARGGVVRARAVGGRVRVWV